jgi:hypothetical protein
VVAAGLVLAGAGQASAQGVASVSTPDQMRARYQISVMEGALERAVQLGAQRLSRQVQAVSSDMLFIATAARAKGFGVVMGIAGLTAGSLHPTLLISPLT